MNISVPWDHTMGGIKICVLLTIALHCDGASITERLAHIARRHSDSSAVILGVPQYPNHLPAAEPILPGHTLIRPAMGMLKSSIKFPHREQEAGSGVYGHVENLGIKYGGRNERVLYSGFRRMMPRKAKHNYLVKRRNNIYQPNVKNLLHKQKHGFANKKLKRKLTIFPASVLTMDRPKIPSYVARMPTYEKWENTNWEPRHEKTENSEPNKVHEIENLIRKLIKRDIIKHYLDINNEPSKKRKKKSQKYYRKQTDIEDEYGRPKKNWRDNPSNIETSSAIRGLKDYLHIITSLRREEEVQKEEPEKLPPSGIGLATFVTAHDSEPEEDAAKAKSKTFWETKDAFNHIKINPEAPEHADLLPSDAVDNIRDWWYYQQSDFEEFKDR